MNNSDRKISIPDVLKSTFLFSTLNSEQIKLVAQCCSIKELGKGELLFSDGQQASAFFVIVTGKVKIYKLSSEGVEHILHIHNPPDLVAEAAIFDRGYYPAYCEALSDTNLLRISRTDFINLLNHFPEISLRLMGAYSRRLRYFVSVIEELSLRDLKARLARYLIQESKMKDGILICDLSVTKKELASLLGTIPETISRTLSVFKKNGWIREDKGNRIIIMNKDPLMKLI